MFADQVGEYECAGFKATQCGTFIEMVVACLQLTNEPMDLCGLGNWINQCICNWPEVLVSQGILFLEKVASTDAYLQLLNYMVRRKWTGNILLEGPMEWHSATPLIHSLEQNQRPTQPRLSLRDAYPIKHTLNGQQVQTDIVVFTDDRYAHLWKWTNRGVYTAASAYSTMTAGGKIVAVHKPIWKLPIPPTVKIFAYLLLKIQILTQALMQRRNMGVDGGCQMCLNCPSVSALHLIFLCPTSGPQLRYGMKSQSLLDTDLCSWHHLLKKFG